MVIADHVHRLPDRLNLEFGIENCELMRNLF